MTTTGMSIRDFLLARIAEDEELARDSYYEGQSWLPEEEAVVAGDQDLDYVFMMDRKRDAQHAAHWSPARALRECAAKRAIIERLGPDEKGYFPVRNLTIQIIMASAYSDHPDYQYEWKP